MRYTSLVMVLALISSSILGVFVVEMPNADAASISLPPELVSNTLYRKSSPDVVATDDGKIYVVWSELFGPGYDIFLSYSINNGTTFTNPKRVNNITNGNQQYPGLAVNDAGVLFVVWWDQSNDTGDIILTRSLDGGDSFEDEICVHTDKAGMQSYPDITVNGNDVAVAWEDPISNNSIRIWNAGDGALQRQLYGHSDAVRSVQYSPDDTVLASGAEDNLVKLWNPQTGALIRNLTDHTDVVTTVNWSSDGTLLATGSWDYNVTIWDTSNYNVITRLYQTDNGTGNVPLKNPVNAIAFSPDATTSTGQIAAAYNGKFKGMPTGAPTFQFNLTVWNLTDYSNWTRNETIGGHSKSVMDVAFSHNGTLLASGAKDNTVKIWNPTTGALLSDVNLNRNVLSLSWSPNDTHIAAGLLNGSVVVFNISNPADRYWMNRTHTGRVNSVSWGEVRDEIVSGASDPKAKVWNQTSRTERLNLSNHFNSVYSVDWASGGNFLATGGGNSGEYQMGESQIFCVLSTDAGQNFSTPVIVTDTCANKRFRPKLGMDSNSNISVVWYDLRSGGEDIYYTNSTDGITFSENIGISKEPGITENVPEIAVEGNGRVHVVWQHQAGINWEIRYANSTDGFVNDKVLANDGQLPRIATSSAGSAVWVTWRESRMMADVSYDHGVTFNDLTQVTTSYFSGSSISLDSYDQASIVWLEGGTANNENVYYVSSVDDVWRPMVIGTLPAPFAADVSIFTSILVNFSEPMNQASVETAFSIYNGTYLNAGDCEYITWNDYGEKVNFTLTYPFDYTDEYTVTINNTAADLSGNTLLSFYSFTFNTSADIDPPVIEHQPILELSYDQEFLANATIIDWWGTVASATLYYQGVTDTAFTPQAMTFIGNDNYTATIPAQGTLGTVYYYFEASDNNGNQGRLPVNNSLYFNYSVVDGTMPVITHLPDTESAVHQPIGVGAVISDEIGLTTVELFYMGVGEVNFTMIAMLPNTTYDPNGYSCTIPAQHEIGELHYNITAQDTAGNLANTSLFALTITDLTKPDINSVIPEHRENETQVLIRANVTDDVAVNEVTLYFKAVGGDHWVVRNMAQVANNTYEFTIPAQRKSGTIYYYVNATDTSGNVASTLTEQDQFQIEVVGTSTNWITYIILAVILVCLIVILVYLMIKKYRPKPVPPAESPDTQVSGTEEETAMTPTQTPESAEGQESDTISESTPEQEPTIQERVDA